MKHLLKKIAVPICFVFLLASCDKNDEPAPEPIPEQHPVEKVLNGNYWKEKICFTYIEHTVMDPTVDSDENKGMEVLVSKDILDEFIWGGGTYLSARLNEFFVNPETKKVHVYAGPPYIGNRYYQNLYNINYIDQDHIAIGSPKELHRYVGAAIDVELKVVSCTEHEIVLDGPIKPYIWQNWMLDLEAEKNNIMYLGIRVYWTKIENGAEIYEPSTPLD